MGHEAYVLLDPGVPLEDAAGALRAVLEAPVAVPYLEGRLVNLGDVDGDHIRGDVEESFGSPGPLLFPPYALMLTLSDCSGAGRGETYLDAAAGRTFDRIAAGTPWRIGLCLLDEAGDLVITRERVP